jgi:hypothetical protein
VAFRDHDIGGATVHMRQRVASLVQPGEGVMPFHGLVPPAVVGPRDTCDRGERGAAELALLPNDDVGLPLQQSLPIVEQRGGA